MQFDAGEQHQKENRKIGDGAENFVFRQAGQHRKQIGITTPEQTQREARNQLGAGRNP